jgi:hypothetical protein
LVGIAGVVRPAPSIVKGVSFSMPIGENEPFHAGPERIFERSGAVSVDAVEAAGAVAEEFAFGAFDGFGASQADAMNNTMSDVSGRMNFMPTLSGED